MQFSSVQQAQDFLAQIPDVEMFELFILDAIGVPCGDPSLSCIDRSYRSSAAARVAAQHTGVNP
jgi:hypothetical protein